jgi:hypothetical protein
VEVPDERLERLRGEAASVADDCVRVLAHLRRLLADPRDTLRYADVAHLMTEMRDHLLSHENVAPLKAFISLLWEMASDEAPSWDPDRHAALYELLDSCGDRHAVTRLLASMPWDQRRLEPGLIEVLDRACPDPLHAVLDVLETEHGTALRAVARQLVEHYGARRGDLLQERFNEARGQAASDLLRAIAGIGGEWAPAFIARQGSHPDKAVQDEALWHLETMPYSGAVGRAFFDAFRWAEPPRRARLLGLMARTGDRRFVDLLAGYVDEHAPQLEPEQAALVGRVLGQLGGESSVARWEAWLQPGGLFRKSLQGPLARQVAALLALSEIRAAPAGDALATALEWASPEAQPWALGAIAHRERLLHGQDGP